MLKSFDEVIEKAIHYGPKRISVAVSQAEDVMSSVEQARQMGLVKGILVGDKEETIEVCKKLDIDPQNYEIINKQDKDEAARTAVNLVREKNAELLMKGMLGTARILRAVLDKEIGLRTNRLLSHAYVLKIKKYEKLLTVTDGAMNIAPGLDQKIQIVQNVIDFCHCLEIEKPKIAILAAVELVNPDMPASLHAACLSKMADRGQIEGGIVDGPLAFDNAISKEAALHKGINSPVSGEVDAVVVPEIESGNIFAKGLVYLAEAEPAGVLLGTTAPVVLVSRSDRPISKVRSIALGILMSVYQNR
ncbi:MAG: bifunctional enoyl-CoA hydratase/phosphate acetyltransferase [Atribacterota bacterium]|nr:bifunctional enoyl-CoA hydratase/phosphate acetyltransferase [Atribacterota bacterium]MDD4895526.1 bifunctional enoyl-CoA hydratase/phosphate acetyltransferase [Atribacterota bacterium]MDD5637702.1 bifunctional enoyl-CoA hydratase/phosphate acetyltransferase [Atribacterota bacterium]